MSSPLPPNRIRRAGALRGLAGCATLIGAAVCAAGCGAGFNPTSLQVEPGSGAARIGGLRINGVVVVADPATREAEVVAAVANVGSAPDRLLSVTAGAVAATVQPARSVSPLAGLPGNNVTVAGNTVTIARGSSVSFGQPGRPALELSGDSLVPGHFTRVEFSFAGAGRTAVNALIMPNTGVFKSYNLSPAASSSSSPGTSPSPGSTARSSSSAGPSAVASASPTSAAASVATSGAASNPAAITAVNTLATPSRAAHLTGSREPRH